jgi:hypothetical protein
MRHGNTAGIRRPRVPLLHYPTVAVEAEERDTCERFDLARCAGDGPPVDYRRPARARPATTAQPTPERRRGYLLRHLDGAALANDDDLDLARVLQLIFDLTGDLVREQDGSVVVDLGRLDDHADLPSRLQRVGLRNA